MLKNQSMLTGGTTNLRKAVLSVAVICTTAFLAVSQIKSTFPTSYPSRRLEEQSEPLVERFLLNFLNVREESFPRRHLTTEDDGNNGDDSKPIVPKDRICRNYLAEFLNGSTDARDECEGLENAYAGANCSDPNPDRVTLIGYDSSNATNVTDDDDGTTPVIDDFFEEFQCCQVINHYYSRRCLYHQRFASLSLLGIVAVLILSSLVKTAIQAFNLKWLPDAGGFILVGSLLGAIMTSKMSDYQMNLGTFNDDLFLYILLPPIIFNASLSIDKKKFKAYLFPVFMFAVLGTLISAVTTGFIVYGLTSAGSMMTSIPLLDSMIFGALISSIDPVATLSILDSLGVSDTNILYVVVFGESILNDGVSIAMFDSLVMHLQGHNPTLDRDIVSQSTKHFFKVSGISVGIGLGIGLICTLWFWALRERQSPVTEVGTFFCFALLAYYISDSLECSGIVSIMTAGFFMDIYVRGFHLTDDDLNREMIQEGRERLEADITLPAAREGNALVRPKCFLPTFSDLRVMFSGVGLMSYRAKVHVGFVGDVIANLFETAIFVYLGLFLFSNKKWDDVPLIFTGVFACVVSRVVMIGFVSFAINSCVSIRGFVTRKLNVDPAEPLPLENSGGYIDKNMQLILLFSGVRGAVSLALAENIPLYDGITKHGSQYKPALKAMTSSSIIFTVFVFGASTYYTLKRQNQTSQQNERELSEQGNSLTTSLLADHSLQLNEENHDAQNPPWVSTDDVSAS